MEGFTSQIHSMCKSFEHYNIMSNKTGLMVEIMCVLVLLVAILVYLCILGIYSTARCIRDNPSSGNCCGRLPEGLCYCLSPQGSSSTGI